MCKGREEKGRTGELPWRDGVLTETSHDSVARGLIPILFGLNKREFSLAQVNIGQRWIQVFVRLGVLVDIKASSKALRQVSLYLLALLSSHKCSPWPHFPKEW